MVGIPNDSYPLLDQKTGNPPEKRTQEEILLAISTTILIEKILIYQHQNIVRFCQLKSSDKKLKTLKQ